MKNKKILIGSIFATLLMLSMPVISNIQAQPTAIMKKTENCSICPSTTETFNGLNCIACYALINEAARLVEKIDELDQGDPLHDFYFCMVCILLLSTRLLFCEIRCPHPPE